MITKIHTKVEIWKDIKGCEGCYQISNIGRVKSLSRRIARKGQKIVETRGKVRGHSTQIWCSPKHHIKYKMWTYISKSIITEL